MLNSISVFNLVKMKSILALLSVSFLLISNSVFAQTKSIYLDIGYATGKPDERRGDPFPNYDRGIPFKESYHWDREYFINIGYRKKIKSKYSLSLDLGYSKLIHDYPLSINLGYFGYLIQPLFYKRISYYHRVQLTPSISYQLGKSEVFEIGIEGSMVNSINLYKHVENIGTSFTRWKTDLASIELYPSFYLEIKKLRFDIGVRAFHLLLRDDAVGNNYKAADLHNPIKFQFSMGYKIISKE